MGSAVGKTVDVAGTKVKVKQLLGEGGYSYVFLVKDVGTKRLYAMKRILAQNELTMEVARREVDIMRRLPPSNHLVRFVASDIRRKKKGYANETEIFILTEYCVGGHLVDVMNRRANKRFTEAEVLNIFAQICEAVLVLHSQDPPIAHRDLKIENVLLHESGVFKLCDFGSATTRHGVFSTTQEMSWVEEEISRFTTLQYRPPEMVDLYRKDHIDEKVDIWALGVTLYNIAFYTTPFEKGGALSILNCKYSIPPEPKYSKGLSDLIAFMLVPDPALRPTIDDVIARVAQLRGLAIPPRRLPRRAAGPLTAPPPSVPTTLAVTPPFTASEPVSVPSVPSGSPTPASEDPSVHASSAPGPSSLQPLAPTEGRAQRRPSTPPPPGRGGGGLDVPLQRERSRSLPGEFESPPSKNSLLPVSPANPAGTKSKRALFFQKFKGKKDDHKVPSVKVTERARNTKTSAAPRETTTDEPHSTPSPGHIRAPSEGDRLNIKHLFMYQTWSEGDSDKSSPDITDDEEDAAAVPSTKSTEPSSHASPLRSVSPIPVSTMGPRSSSPSTLSTAKWVLKCTCKRTSPIKLKYLRLLVLDTWDMRSVAPFLVALTKRPLKTHSVVCFKALSLFHMVVQQGPPQSLREGFDNLTVFETIRRTWHGQPRSLAPMITRYASYLSQKILFHHDFPQFEANFSLDTFLVTSDTGHHNNDPCSVETASQLLLLLSSVLDCLESVVAEGYREWKACAAIPMVRDAYAVYLDLVYVLGKVRDNSGAGSLILRFSEKYGEMRSCFRLAMEREGLGQYIPTLLESPPRFDGERPPTVCLPPSFDPETMRLVAERGSKGSGAFVAWDREDDDDDDDDDEGSHDDEEDEETRLSSLRVRTPPPRLEIHKNEGPDPNAFFPVVEEDPFAQGAADTPSGPLMWETAAAAAAAAAAVAAPHAPPGTTWSDLGNDQFAQLISPRCARQFTMPTIPSPRAGGHRRQASQPVKAFRFNNAAAVLGVVASRLESHQEQASDSETEVTDPSVVEATLPPLPLNAVSGPSTGPSPTQASPRSSVTPPSDRVQDTDRPINPFDSGWLEQNPSREREKDDDEREKPIREDEEGATPFTSNGNWDTVVPHWDTAANDFPSEWLPEKGDVVNEPRAVTRTPDPLFELDIDYSELEIGGRVGIGGFGEVLKGVWRGTDVAIKRLIIQDLNAEMMDEFRAEVANMRALSRHPNIVLFMGACMTPPNLAIVTEYCSRGNLFKLLNDPTFDMPLKLLFKMAIDAALGVNYLHCFKPPVLHRDLKTFNLLATENFTVKVCDFGLARVRDISKAMTGKTGTVQWMAPEVLRNELYTEKADVYSFGIVLWEMFTRASLYEGMSPIQVAVAVLNDNLRPTIPAHCPPELARLIVECWDSNPDSRPSFTEIVQRLRILENTLG